MSEPARLFDPDEGAPPPRPIDIEPGARVVRVLPDVSGLDKEFDYVVPATMAANVSVGDLVRVDLHGRRVAGWIVAADVEPEPGVKLRPVTKVSSVGPSAATIDLARWAATRWAGRVTPILKAASPQTMVRSRPKPRPNPISAGRPAAKPPASAGIDVPAPAAPASAGDRDSIAAEAFAAPGTTVVRVPPADDQLRFAAAAAALGDALVLVPEVGRARAIAGRLGRLGHRVHIQPNGWAGGHSGGVVIGSRSTVWAPTGTLAAVVVLDEHDESLQEERVPTWHARDVAIERARRAGVPCVLVSPAPSLVALAAADRVLTVSRSEERRGWPPVEVIDRRDDEPGHQGLFSGRVAQVLRSCDRGIAVLNRKGRAQMLACSSCGELVKTTDGEHLMVERDGELVAPATGETRPLICAVCTGTTLKRLRLGVTRAAEELSKLVGRPVHEVSADTKGARVDGPAADGGLLLGTEAVLHTRGEVDVVVFLDFDQELHAPRYRAAEQAMGLLVRAARLVGGRRPEAKVVVQTRSPDHRVLRAAVAADPGRMLDEERALRAGLGFPPMGAIAELSGAGAPAYADALLTDVSVNVLGPRRDGHYLVRAGDHDILAAALARAERPKERVRVAVDPPRA